MGRHILWFLASLGAMALVTACAQAVPSIPTAVRSAVTATGTVQARAPATAEFVADVYVRALFARDNAMMVRAFPGSKPAGERDEYDLQLDGLSVTALTPEEAGDRNPVTRIEYARAVARVSAKGKEGTYTYTIGTRLENGRRVIGMIRGPMRDW